MSKWPITRNIAAPRLSGNLNSPMAQSIRRLAIAIDSQQNLLLTAEMTGQEDTSATDWLSERKGCHELHLARIIRLALMLAPVLVLTLVVFSWNSRDHYWWGRKFSLSLQSLSPGGPFAGDSWWI